MTDTPMTPARERMIRIWHEELARLTDRTAVARREALGDLLAEVDRLRGALSDATDQVAELESDLGGATAESAALKERLREAAMARVWTNEDGKKFVFVDDIKGPLLSTTPSEPSGRAHLGALGLGADAPPGPRPTGLPVGLTGRARHDARVALETARRAADQNEAAEHAESRADLDAMRADHPAPCRVPDSPDCDCPLTEAQARRIEQDRPDTGIAHEGCTLPLDRLLVCGHCPHQICDRCRRCPHTCFCAA
ncbi:hypothetical protein [Streptomyces drozdowiczii]|uniref:hypothetical protein n=1 Tax=Streptomyces drozdowiczii TaxID=202862 RepID=UPI00403C632B